MVNNKNMTKDQVNKKYAGKYVEFLKDYDRQTGGYIYTILKVYSKIHENTTLGEDVGTAYEYRR